jgi:hypothetical protein
LKCKTGVIKVFLSAATKKDLIRRILERRRKKNRDKHLAKKSSRGAFGEINNCDEIIERTLGEKIIAINILAKKNNRDEHLVKK